MQARPKTARQDGVSLADAAYQEIKQRILSNEFPPNHRAVENELALMLGMSRTPLREALVRLVHEGMVELISRHGMRVLPISPADMLEIYQVITALEAAAAELLARRKLPARDLNALEAIVDTMDAALDKDDLPAWASADEKYHRKLLELCGNKRLTQIGFTFREQVNRARLLTLPLRARPVRSNKAHRDLVRLIRAGKPDEARELHRSQRLRGSTELTEILQRYPLNNL
jgi:DNA-binding GntR family transcriptional regulator